MKIQSAVKKIQEELKKDKGFYYAYQANIAMAFIDSVDGFDNKKTGEILINRKTLHKIANEAAKKFLDLLIG